MTVPFYTSFFHKEVNGRIYEREQIFGLLVDSRYDKDGTVLFRSPLVKETSLRSSRVTRELWKM